MWFILCVCIFSRYKKIIIINIFLSAYIKKGYKQIQKTHIHFTLKGLNNRYTCKKNLGCWFGSEVDGGGDEDKLIWRKKYTQFTSHRKYVWEHGKDDKPILSTKIKVNEQPLLPLRTPQNKNKLTTQDTKNQTSK